MRETMEEEAKRLEIRRSFYLMLVDQRAEKRAAARQSLSSMGDEERMLADAADAVFNGLQGGNQGELDKAIRILGSFAESSFWYGFMESAGQVVLENALKGNLSNETRKSFFEKGLILISRAAAPGFALQNESLALVREGKRSFPKSAAQADMVLMAHAHEEPKASFGKQIESPMKKGAAKERGGSR